MEHREKILLLGPQGSGKGTQAQRLSSLLNIPAFSMGQLLRDEVAAQTPIGKEVKGILDAGELVPERVAAEVLQKRLAKPDAKSGYILDGYPRNLAQMRAFDFDTPTHVFVLDVPLQVSQQRIANRLTCDRCGKVYSTFFGNTAGERCPCGGTMIHREDDQPDIVTKRLEIYDRETSEVIRVFEQRGLVHHVDGTKTPEEVSEALTKFLWTEKLS